MAGKNLGVSVAKLLGGYRKKVKAYASCMHGDHNGGLTTTQDVLSFAAQCEELGFKAFKFHGWGDGDVAAIKNVVKELGREFEDRMDLMLDPGCDLRTFADALAVGYACDDAGFFW